MNGTLANVIGMMGSVTLVIGYGYSNIARPVNFFLFNLLNFIGSALLLVSLIVHFNLAVLLLELLWMALALFGMIRHRPGRGAP